MILTAYMRLLTERNRVIKEFAETDKWKLILKRADHIPNTSFNFAYPALLTGNLAPVVSNNK